jgi:MFS family permease
VQMATKAEQAAAQRNEPPPPKKIDPGLVAALGVGAAGLGGMIGGIVTGFLNLKWMMPVGVLAIVLVISGPSMLLAWLKLRKRNLGPILDANGWAVNSKAKVNVPFGASLTRIAALPPGSQRDLVDPFAEKKSPWPKIFLLLLLLLFVCLALDQLGYIFNWTHGRIGTQRPAPTSSTNAPAKPPGS